MLFGVLLFVLRLSRPPVALCFFFRRPSVPRTSTRYSSRSGRSLASRDGPSSAAVPACDPALACIERSCTLCWSSRFPDRISDPEMVVVLPYMVIKPRDMKAQRNVRKQGNEAEMSEKVKATNSQTTTGTISMLSLPLWRKLK